MGTLHEFGITQQYPLLAKDRENRRRQLEVAAFQNGRDWEGVWGQVGRGRPVGLFLAGRNLGSLAA